MTEADGSSEVYLELGKKRVFACALEWPGWCRSGKSEEAALEALAAYHPRYCAALRTAGIGDPAGVITVVQRIPGVSGHADFGAPGERAAADFRPVDAVAAARLRAAVEASWLALDETAEVSPAALRKGPRGGGRDRDAMVTHVYAAEGAYARLIGIKRRTPEAPDRAFIDDLRTEIVGVIGAPSDGAAIGAGGWPTRYAARRIAWHALDHAWEMQDKSEPAM